MQFYRKRTLHLSWKRSMTSNRSFLVCRNLKVDLERIFYYQFSRCYLLVSPVSFDSHHCSEKTCWIMFLLPAHTSKLHFRINKKYFLYGYICLISFYKILIYRICDFIIQFSWKHFSKKSMCVSRVSKKVIRVHNNIENKKYFGPRLINFFF